MTMSSSAAVRISLLLILSVSGTEGHKTGAPLESCTSMTPNHEGAQSQTINSSVPYSIISSMPIYKSGSKMTVTVSASGSTTFKGLMLQARDSNSKPVGTFSLMPQDSNLQLLACGGTADTGATHTHDNVKTSVKINWTAPTNNVGDITFTATVVKQFNAFYVMVKSMPIGYVANVQVVKEKNSAGSVVNDMAVVIASTSLFLCLGLVP